MRTRRETPTCPPRSHSSGDAVNEPITRRTALQTGVVFASTAALPRGSSAQRPKPPVVEGYTDQLSYAPGDEVKLHVSSAGPVALEATRIGKKFSPITQSGVFSPGRHAIPKDASSHGCRWPVGHSFRLPPDTPSGYYAIDSFGARAMVTGPSVRALPSSSSARRSRARTRRSSSNSRPTPTTPTRTGAATACTPTTAGTRSRAAACRSTGRSRSQFAQLGSSRSSQWAEANGYALDYCVNSDLEFHPELLKHYKLVLSVGHDEYWSAPMRDNLEKFIGDGGNVAFFSGNTCCWQVRSEENGRALACWKQSFGDDPHLQDRRPQDCSPRSGATTSSTGRRTRSPASASCGAATTAATASSWTAPARSPRTGPTTGSSRAPNLKRGDAFGAKLPTYKVVGYECDGCELAWKDGLPFPTHRDGTPKNFEVLATCPGPLAPGRLRVVREVGEGPHRQRRDRHLHPRRHGRHRRHHRLEPRPARQRRRS